MASKPNHPLILDYSPQALSDLDVIWDWNANHYGDAHASQYLEFLHRQTEKLKINSLGLPVPTRPEYLYLTIRRRSKGHGHVVVFEIAGNRIHVLRYFHTSQDWQSTLIDKP
jgi:plasmid stabilization system protein ParE